MPESTSTIEKWIGIKPESLKSGARWVVLVVFGLVAVNAALDRDTTIIQEAPEGASVVVSVPPAAPPEALPAIQAPTSGPVELETRAVALRETAQESPTSTATPCPPPTMPRCERFGGVDGIAPKGEFGHGDCLEDEVMTPEGCVSFAPENAPQAEPSNPDACLDATATVRGVRLTFRETYDANGAEQDVIRALGAVNDTICEAAPGADFCPAFEAQINAVYEADMRAGGAVLDAAGIVALQALEARLCGGGS